HAAPARPQSCGTRRLRTVAAGLDRLWCAGRTALCLLERPPADSRAEDFRPDIVTELYADDGQIVGSFALQRRILLTYEQIPQVLKDAILSTEDQHFDEHWGVDFTRVA